MKKFFSSLVIAFTLVFAPVKKSEAVVGLFTGGTVIAVGALVVASGIGTIYVADKKCRDEGCVLGYAILGLLGAGLGLVVLDGQQAVAFTEVNSSMNHLKGVSVEEIETYNAELDQLNAVNEQITAEINADKNTDATARWSEMSALLSPATMKIAGLNGELFLKSLK